MRDIGTLGGLVSSARDINNAGKIVGVSATGEGSDQHAFLYDKGEMLDLGSLGGNFSVAEAINSKGQIVGASSIGEPEPGELFHAFLYEKGVMRDLGTLDGTGNSFAFDINDKGQIVGGANTHAFLFTERTWTIDLGTLAGGDNSVARAINNRGDIVGRGQIIATGCNPDGCFGGRLDPIALEDEP